MKTGFMRMIVFDKRIILSAIILLTVITACVKTNSTPVVTPGNTTIAGIVKAGSNLTLLDSAMSKTGLLATLDSPGPYTLFAPLDIAFTNAGFTDSTIYKDSANYLKRLILYHILAGYGKTIAILQSEITSANFPIVSASGDTLFLTLDSTGLFVNGNFVTQSDIIAKNGVIQALSGLLIPPSGNIYQTLNSLSLTTDTTLTFLVEALKIASQSIAYGNLDTLLSSGGVFTILAPTNAAFQSFGDTTIAAIDNSNADTLARILQCHLLKGRVFSSDFPSGKSLISYAGDSLAFSTTFGFTVQSRRDTVASSIISVNKLATNGLIHKINQILNY